MGKLINRLPWIRRRKQHELDRELRYHLDRRVDELRASGLDEAEARRRARLEFGGVVQVKEAVHDTWTHRWLDVLGLDIGYGIRVLRRRPGFTATAVLRRRRCGSNRTKGPLFQPATAGDARWLT